jgi:uncharacterized protein YggU (UPF0235/DUF167 family)
MASKYAIRLVAASTKSQSPSIHLQCHVKPGASKRREGVTAITDEAIELCVAAAAREGEANKAAREVIGKILKVPKSNVEIIKGLKLREKTIAIFGIDALGDQQSCIAKVKEQIQESAK